MSRCRLFHAITHRESHAKQSRSNFPSNHRHAVSFPCHFCSSVLPWCSFTSTFFVHTPSFFFSICLPSFVLPTELGCLSTSCKSSSEAMLCASFINDRLPVRTAFFSNCRTGLSLLILVALYSASSDLRPFPPSLLGRYNSSVDPCGCFAPFSTIHFLLSRASRWSSAIGQTCVHMKYVIAGNANWLVAKILL